MLPGAGGEGALSTAQMWLNKDCRLASDVGFGGGTDLFSVCDAGSALGATEQPNETRHKIVSASPASAPAQEIFCENIFELLTIFILP
jgi:hypothetical protein